MADNKKTIKVILLGQTGSGKSDFINLFGNYAELHENFDFQKIHAVVDESQNSLTESITVAVTRYNFEFKDCIIQLIDAPGFADNRGIAQEDRNKTKIMKFFEENEVNCLCLVFNGTLCRMNESLQKSFLELTKILSATILENTIIIFTHASDVDLEVKRELKQEIKKQLLISVSRHNTLAINNPYSKWRQWNPSLAKAASADKMSNMITESFKYLDAFSEIVKSFGTTLSDLVIAHSNLKDEIDLKIREICSIKRNRHKTHVMEISEIEDYCTLCMFPDCYSNCHRPCQYAGFWIKAAKYCKIFDEDDICSVCGHDYSHHRRSHKIHKIGQSRSGEFESNRDEAIIGLRKELLLLLTKYHRNCHRPYEEIIRHEIKLRVLSQTQDEETQDDFPNIAVLYEVAQEAIEINKLPFDTKLPFEKKVEWALVRLGLDSIKPPDVVQKEVDKVTKFCCRNVTDTKCLDAALHAKGILNDHYHRQ